MRDFFEVVSLKKGEIFFVRHIIPDGVDRLVRVSEANNGVRLAAKADILLVAEGVTESLRSARHVRFIRKSRRGASNLMFVSEKPWPRLRAALLYSGVQPVRVPGGFSRAILYGDEIAVPNFSVSGSSGWIIRRCDIQNYLNAMPPLPDEDGQLDPTKPVATFYVAWNGRLSSSFFGVFATRQEAEAMTWDDPAYQRPGRIQQPKVTEWKVAMTLAGNPVVLAPSHPPYWDKSAPPVATVPFRDYGAYNGSYPVTAGAPVAKGGYLAGQTHSCKGWGQARYALLSYYERFASPVNLAERVEELAEAAGF